MDLLTSSKPVWWRKALRTQIEGIDYEKTFSPVVRFAFIRLLLAPVAHLDLELFQMDLRTAFLNGNLQEEIYMDQPIGFVSKGQEDKVCRPKRSIYGLKQSSRLQYFRFHEAITSFGFFNGFRRPLCLCQENNKGDYVPYFICWWHTPS